MRRLMMLVTVLTVASVLVACGGSMTTPPPPTPPAQTTPPATTPPATTPPAPAIDAKALYTTNCAGCHGQDRKGVAGLGPDLTPGAHGDHTVDQIEDIIEDGITGKAMPSFRGKLSSAEIDALARFIKTTP